MSARTGVGCELGGLTLRWSSPTASTIHSGRIRHMASPRTASGPTPRRADYGLDAPGVVRTLGSLGTAFVVVGAVLLSRHPLAGARALANIALWMGGSWAAAALLMLASSRFGKLRARDRLLDRLALRGDETVLDVGCGHGLMLIGAARRLPRGRAIGIDLWSHRDQAANSAEATLANAEAEGVGERVEVRDGDMRNLPFDDASIDVVVSSLAIHNVPTPDERALAIAEIVRVLRPGGRVGILDIAHVGDYARILRERGCTVDRVAFVPTIFPPTRELIASRS
jgi:arsenite methyltransferase